MSDGAATWFRSAGERLVRCPPRETNDVQHNTDEGRQHMKESPHGFVYVPEFEGHVSIQSPRVVVFDDEDSE